MKADERIKQKLGESLQPALLELENESHMHAGPATESHFKLVLVTDVFAGMSRVQRHQRVFSLLQDELLSSGKGPVHALSLHLFTPAEWNKITVPESPLCAGNNNE